jgi:L-alanine-DL-glutamate epimerase-like enolase superfamily enzyme
VAEGWGSMFLAIGWAWPTDAVDALARDGAMRQVVERYAKALEGHSSFAHPIDIALKTEPTLLSNAAETSRAMQLAEPIPVLASLVCGSPFDGALHDAFGNVNGISSYDGYSDEFMAEDLSAYLGSEFKGQYLDDYVRPAYVAELPVFHLVGGLDKLWEHEITADDPDDGEPVSLDQWIARDGVYCLKIKLLGNDMDWDVQRTLDVYAIGKEALSKQGREEIYLTADTNEICETPDYMVEYLERVREQSPAAYDALLYVEQPTHRDLDRAPFRMEGIDKLKPVIMDESLYNHHQYERAKELGWSGIALKVCKGHSHSLLFTALATHDGLPYTVQDLTNPDLSLIHSVSFAARINPMKGVECNSRQFFPASNSAVAAVHPRIANVRNGVARTDTLTGTGLGYQVDRILAHAP